LDPVVKMLQQIGAPTNERPPLPSFAVVNGQPAVLFLSFLSFLLSVLLDRLRSQWIFNQNISEGIFPAFYLFASL